MADLLYLKLRSKICHPFVEKMDQECISNMESDYLAKFICMVDHTIRVSGKFRQVKAGLFWTQKVHPKGSNWFCMFYFTGNFYVTDGIATTNKPIKAIVAKDKNIYYSCGKTIIADDGSGWINSREVPGYGKVDQKDPFTPELIQLYISPDGLQFHPS